MTPEERAEERASGGKHSGYAVLPLAMICVASSSVMHRFTEAPPIAVAGWRCLLAAIVLLMWPSAREGVSRLSGRDLVRTCAAAILLACHFGTWIASLRLLPISVSILLVNTHPVFVLLFRVLGGSRVTVPELLGVGLSLAGIVLMQNGTGTAPPSSVLGSILAVAGALTFAGYLVVGSSVRQRVRTSSYLLLVYGLGSLTLFTFLAGTGGSLAPPSPHEFALYLLIAAIPTLTGHGLFAYAIGYVPPVVISVSFLAEPLLATLMAIPFFHEIPGTSVLLGGSLVLAGLAIVTMAPGKSSS